jgi:hypothetical protein
MRHSPHAGLHRSDLSGRSRHSAPEFSEHERIRRIRRHGNARRGRVLLALFLALFVGLDLAFYFNCSPALRHLAPGFVISDIIWMTALFTAAWCKQMWARFILAAVLLIEAFVILVVVSDFMEGGLDIKDPLIAAITVFSGATRAVCGWMMIAWRDFKRLTSRGDCG